MAGVNASFNANQPVKPSANPATEANGSPVEEAVKLPVRLLLVDDEPGLRTAVKT